MIFYIASCTYAPIITAAIEESSQLVVGQEVDNDLFLYKYIKEKGNQMTGFDKLIIDLSAIQDTEKEIVEALEMYRSINDKVRIIVLSSQRRAGNELLTEIYQMGIWDIIATDDFVEIKHQLEHCILAGTPFREAQKYKEVLPSENVITRLEIKRRVVEKILVSVAGTQPRTGVTHNSIILANFLRKKGYRVALVEMNPSGHFKEIQEAYEEQVFEGKYFSIDGVDYYAAGDPDKLSSIMGKSYNFIVCDFGVYNQCDRVTYNKAAFCFIISGSQSWETCQMNSVFRLSSEEALKRFHFFFLFASAQIQPALREGMAGLGDVHFLQTQLDPFTSSAFADGEEIFCEYLPQMQQPEKSGLRGRFQKTQKRRRQ